MMYFQINFFYNTFTLYIILKSVFRCIYNYRFKAMMSFIQNIQYNIWTKSKFAQFSYFNSSEAEELLKQLAKSTKRLAQELLLNTQHNGGLRNFAVVTRVLKMMSIVVWPSGVDNDHLRALVEANPHTTV